MGSVKKQERFMNVLLYGIFIIYILFLLKLLVLSRMPMDSLFSREQDIKRSFTIVPFRTIGAYLWGASENTKRFAFANVAGNMIAFVPLGVYLKVFLKDQKGAHIAGMVVMISLCIEIVQGVLGIGTADIDDIILNSLGGLLGIAGYKLLVFGFKDQKKAHAVVAGLSVLGLPVLLYLLFFIRLRL